MLPTMHPLSKTAVDLRRSINRLMIFKAQNTDDSYVLDGTVDNIIHDLQEAKRHIPKELSENEG